MTSIYHRAYLHGYARQPAPRWLRRFIARSEIHRAWLAGYLGFFESDGVAYGPAYPYPQFPDCDADEDAAATQFVDEGFPYHPDRA
ncbi:hypothetical protein [Loktanella sp. SALINAS62]|uniref:hypothetical protein n=1 Tax=Loktanella sp. SALINAS62 TaxID=2706124 RepID=UPI001B8C7B96|nr:hypothetical protein [Loktanella sp. SALINAS62]MBS1303425.1 hypothetical protein [Loktanella sp. SALINAS62]